jgi:adenylate kinase
MILLMGIAGSGKGTQGKMLSDQHKLHLVSMGDVVRMYVTGEQRERMLAGELLNDSEVISIVDKVLDSITSNEEVLIDGFPRTIPQAEWLLKKSREGNHLKLDLAIHLVASRQAVKERLIKRARMDDKDKAIEARFDEYEKATMPLIAWLKENNIKVANVNAERPVQEVNQDLVSLLQQLNEK